MLSMSSRTISSHVRNLTENYSTLLRKSKIETNGRIVSSQRSRSLSSFASVHSVLPRNESYDEEDDHERPSYRSDFIRKKSILSGKTFQYPHATTCTGIQSRYFDASSSTKRTYHASARNERLGLVLGLGSVALTAKAGQYAVRAYEEYKKNLPEEEPVSETTSTNAQQQKEKQEETKNNSSEEKRENIFHSWFGTGTKFYEGGFEEKMTRREAALILGVRESSSAARIKNAHRKILILNHPDTGGSTYIASKLNEAKELLLKGKED